MSVRQKLRRRAEFADGVLMLAGYIAGLIWAA